MKTKKTKSRKARDEKAGLEYRILKCIDKFLAERVRVERAYDFQAGREDWCVAVKPRCWFAVRMMYPNLETASDVAASFRDSFAADLMELAEQVRACK